MADSSCYIQQVVVSSLCPYGMCPGFRIQQGKHLMSWNSSLQWNLQGQNSNWGNMLWQYVKWPFSWWLPPPELPVSRHLAEQDSLLWWNVRMTRQSIEKRGKARTVQVVHSAVELARMAKSTSSLNVPLSGKSTCNLDFPCKLQVNPHAFEWTTPKMHYLSPEVSHNQGTVWSH